LSFYFENLGQPLLTFILLEKSMEGHSLPNNTKNVKMLPLITNFHEIFSAYNANHSEQNDTNRVKSGQWFQRCKSSKIGCFYDQSCMKFF